MKKKSKSFPDLSGDGKVTMKDVLMGRGVIKGKKMKQGREDSAQDLFIDEVLSRVEENILLEEEFFEILEGLEEEGYDVESLTEENLNEFFNALRRGLKKHTGLDFFTAKEDRAERARKVGEKRFAANAAAKRKRDTAKANAPILARMRQKEAEPKDTAVKTLAAKPKKKKTTGSGTEERSSGGQLTRGAIRRRIALKKDDGSHHLPAFSDNTDIVRGSRFALAERIIREMMKGDVVSRKKTTLPPGRREPGKMEIRKHRPEAPINPYKPTRMRSGKLSGTKGSKMESEDIVFDARLRLAEAAIERFFNLDETHEFLNMKKRKERIAKVLKGRDKQLDRYGPARNIFSQLFRKLTGRPQFDLKNTAKTRRKRQDLIDLRGKKGELDQKEKDRRGGGFYTKHGDRVTKEIRQKRRKMSKEDRYAAEDSDEYRPDKPKGDKFGPRRPSLTSRGEYKDSDFDGARPGSRRGRADRIERDIIYDRDRARKAHKAGKKTFKNRFGDVVPIDNNQLRGIGDR